MSFCRPHKLLDDEPVPPPELQEALPPLCFVLRNELSSFESWVRNAQGPKAKAGLAGTSKDGRTMLHHAVMRNRPGFVPVLLANGVLPDRVDNRRNTALHYAAASTDPAGLQCAQMLLHGGAHIDATNNDFNTPLHEAVLNGTAEMVSLLVKPPIGAGGREIVGAGVELLNRTNRAPYDLAIERNNEAVLSAFVDAYPELALNGSALRVAAEAGADESARALIAAGCPLDSADHLGWTPLHLAAKYGHSALVAIILEAARERKITLHANAEARRHERGGSVYAVHLAARAGDALSVMRLIDAGADPSLQDRLYWTALHYAAESKSGLAAAVVLQAFPSIDINAVDSDNLTALAKAAEVGAEDVVSVLLGRGLPATPEDSAVAKELIPFGFSLDKVSDLKHTADANILFKQRYTALHFAAQNGHETVVKILLDNGADPTLWRGRWSPSALAERAGFTSLAQFLKNAASECKPTAKEMVVEVSSPSAA